MKYTSIFVLAALLGSVEETNAVRVSYDYWKKEKKEDKEYPHWMDGFGGYHTYKRDVPDRFETEADDTLMRSMYENYAFEGKKDGHPTGHFWLDKKGARAASKEVVRTHLKLDDAGAEGYLKENFEDLFAKYDVNEEGILDIDRMPQFLRTICGNTEACVGLQ